MATKRCAFCGSEDIEIEEKFIPLASRKKFGGYLVYCYDCAAEYSCTKSMSVTETTFAPILPITSVYNDDQENFPPEEED